MSDESLHLSIPPAVRVVRGTPDEIELAALVAGLATATVAALPDDGAPVDEWTNRVRGLRDTSDGATTKNFGGRTGRHHVDAWRWSLRS